MAYSHACEATSALVQEERAVLRLWEETDAFRCQVHRRQAAPEFTIFDGPPFATGLPHYGHLLTGFVKDTAARFASATGHHCPRSFGWDCHGLPVEQAVDTELGPNARHQLSLAAYNDHCRRMVTRHTPDWHRTVTRSGRWVDFDGYRTMDPAFMDGVWWTLKSLWERGDLYLGNKVVPYCTECDTVLANFEADDGRRELHDTAYIVAFPIIGAADGAALLAHVHDPWTLTYNLAVGVHPGRVYVKAQHEQTGAVLIVEENAMHSLPNKGKAYRRLDTLPSESLQTTRYAPLFDRGAHPQACCVLLDATPECATGVMPLSPALCEDACRICAAADLKHDSGVCIRNGLLLQGWCKGCTPQQADALVLHALEDRGLLVGQQNVTRHVAFCPRSDTRLVHQTVPSWFVRVEPARERLLELAAQTHWVPTHVRDGRFRQWLRGARDWAISRSRSWGNPLPIWTSADGTEVRVVGSLAELQHLSGCTLTDAHRPWVDDVTIPSQRGGPPLRRVPEVFDCWFESGCMPHASRRDAPPFAPSIAHLIAEGIDQTRGWFYTLLVIATLLFDAPPTTAVVCTGLILAADGKKMSKRLRNYPDPVQVMDRHGADGLRLYLLASPVVRGEDLRFQDEDVAVGVRTVQLPWLNAHKYLEKSLASTGLTHPHRCTDRGDDPLDAWLRLRTDRLALGLRADLQAHRLDAAVSHLHPYVEDLTNTYVRYCRKRLKAGCRHGLAALHSALHTACVAAAPLLPLFCEHLYQRLRPTLPADCPESVHWCDYPQPHPSPDRTAVVDDLKRIVRLTLKQRDRLGHPLVQPLASLTVVCTDCAHLAAVASYIEDEANVLKVSFDTDVRRLTAARAVPHCKLLVQRLGGRPAARVISAARAMTTEQLDAWQSGVPMRLADHTLVRDEVLIERSASPSAPSGFSWDGHLGVELDPAIDDGLLLARLARELAASVQRARKALGLVVTQKVDVRLLGCAPQIAQAVRAHSVELTRTLGCMPQVAPDLPADADVLATERLRLGDSPRTRDGPRALSPRVPPGPYFVMESSQGTASRRRSVISYSSRCTCGCRLATSRRCARACCSRGVCPSATSKPSSASVSPTKACEAASGSIPRRAWSTTVCRTRRDVCGVDAVQQSSRALPPQLGEHVCPVHSFAYR